MVVGTGQVSDRWRSTDLRKVGRARLPVSGRRIAVGLTILAMDLTGTFHPPAGIDPLLVVFNNGAWSYLAVTVLAGALLLTLFAYVWRRWLHRQPWPQRRL
jgi:CBS-domain-containing membrane protein